MFVNGTLVLDDPIVWVDLGLSLLIVAIMVFIMSKAFKSKLTISNLWLLFVLMFASWFFGLKFVWAICLALLGSLVAIVFIKNPKELSHGINFMFPNKKKINVERIYDRDLVCEKVATAVESFSKSKTGALITFEREDKFNDIVKSGTILESPVSPELISTIFYPGTRLHDGAIVIRRDQILAASVYYTPTTKPLTGKYGSRHRAALGISEVTDSITIIVSEETGRISIAKGGELIPVAPDKVFKTLKECLSEK